MSSATVAGCRSWRHGYNSSSGRMRRCRARDVVREHRQYARVGLEGVSDPRTSRVTESPRLVRVERVAEDDWSVLRAVRLEGLATDPAAFGSSWDSERDRPKAFWRARLSSAAWFLAWHEDAAIGVLACVASPTGDDELQLDAMWVALAWSRCRRGPGRCSTCVGRGARCCSCVTDRGGRQRTRSTPLPAARVRRYRAERTTPARPRYLAGAAADVLA